MSGREIEEIYNQNKGEDYHPEANWFAMSNGRYVIEARYFTEEGLKALREEGYEIKYIEPHPKPGEEDTLVGLHIGGKEE